MSIQFLNSVEHTDISRLRSEAKKRAKAESVPLSTALNIIAQEKTGAASWSEMMADHVVTVSEDNGISFPVISPDQSVWSLRAQIVVPLDALRDDLLSNRTVSYRAKSFASKRRNRIELTLGTRGLTLGHGTSRHTLNDMTVSEVRTGLLSSSARLKASAAVRVLTSILEATPSVWTDISSATYSALVIDPITGDVTETTHDGTLQRLTELAGLSYGQNLIATVLDETGLIAVHLKEQFTKDKGMVSISGKEIGGRVVLIRRDPKTGDDLDLPDVVPLVSIAPAQEGLSSFPDMFNDPNNVFGRDRGMSEEIADYPEAEDGDGPIDLVPSIDLSRVVSPVVYRARIGKHLIELSGEGRDVRMHAAELNADGLVDTGFMPVTVRHMAYVERRSVLAQIDDACGDRIPQGHWAHRGVSVRGRVILDPINDTDMMLFRASRDAARAARKEASAALAECPMFVPGGKKGDWVIARKPRGFIKQVGVDLDETTAPKETPADYVWLVLSHEGYARAAILLPEKGGSKDPSEWEGQARLHVNSGMDDAWTYAAALADLLCHYLQDPKIGLDLAEWVVRTTDDIPDFDIRDHLGLDESGEPIAIPLYPGMEWDGESYGSP